MLLKYININVHSHACYLGIYNLMMRQSSPRCYGQVCGLIPLVSASISLTALNEESSIQNCYNINVFIES